MSIIRKIRTAIKLAMVGETVLPEEFATGIRDPQQEIAVMLLGMGQPIDVTFRHSTACSAPFLFAIAFDEGRSPTRQELGRLSLNFFEREGKRDLLGSIRLRWKEKVSDVRGELHLFAPRSVSNYCLPRLSLWAHYSKHLLGQWKSKSASAMTMSFLERRAAMVSFIRPHPTVLVSVSSALGINIFPMNIMGSLGPDRFGFALRNDRLAGQLVEGTGRLVLSNVLVRHASLAYGLAPNHTKAFIQRNELPFSTVFSPMFQYPVPEFAVRIREMELETVRRIGSHSFFVARILRDTALSDEPSLCVIHGYYETRRLKGRAAEMKSALLEDYLNKHGEVSH
jgi:flavin reductase (DIM6/NTAB) family NADH-FMN oxidoreductase RutF